MSERQLASLHRASRAQESVCAIVSSEANERGAGFLNNQREANEHGAGFLNNQREANGGFLKKKSEANWASSKMTRLP